VVTVASVADYVPYTWDAALSKWLRQRRDGGIAKRRPTIS